MRHAHGSLPSLRRGPALAGWLTALLAAHLLTVARAGDSTGPLVGATSSVALPDPGWAVVRVMAALALVLGLFALGVWLFRNWQRMLAHGRPPNLRILEVRPLGGRQTLYVVAYERERFLLAASPQGLHLLTHLPPLAQEDPETAEAPMPAPQGWSSVFAAVLRQVRSKGV